MTDQPIRQYSDMLVVESYRNDQNQQRWAFRCWGTNTCDGLLSLDHTSRQWAERARDRHVAEEHPEVAAEEARALAEEPRATPDSPATPSPAVDQPQPLTPCTCRQAIHTSEHRQPVNGCPWCEGGDRGAAHDDGPSVQEAAADDRRWFDGERDGE